MRASDSAEVHCHAGSSRARDAASGITVCNPAKNSLPDNPGEDQTSPHLEWTHNVWWRTDQLATRAHGVVESALVRPIAQPRPEPSISRRKTMFDRYAGYHFFGIRERCLSQQPNLDGIQTRSGASCSVHTEDANTPSKLPKMPTVQP